MHSAPTKAGNLYFCDMKPPSIVRISAADGTRQEICQESVGPLEFSSDGSLLYGCQRSALITCILADPDHSTLYIAHGTKIYRRTLTVERPKP